MKKAETVQLGNGRIKPCNPVSALDDNQIFIIPQDPMLTVHNTDGVSTHEQLFRKINGKIQWEKKGKVKLFFGK